MKETPGDFGVVLTEVSDDMGVLKLLLPGLVLVVVGVKEPADSHLYHVNGTEDLYKREGVCHLTRQCISWYMVSVT
jgi:hypothetical protein